MDHQTSASGGWLKWALVAGVLAILAGIAFRAMNGGAESEGAAQYLLKEAPDGAVDVLALRNDAQHSADVVVVGRIGGRADPWVEGTAAFPIVDRSLKPCSEIEGDTCATPWDYCCEPNLADATVLVMFVDEEGKAIKQDPRELLRVKELQTVTVQGTAKRDEAGNITVLASKLHVNNSQP